MKLFRRKLIRYGWLSIIGLVLILLSIISIRLTIARYQTPHPQAILVLGGDSGREETAAQLARYYPELDVWVSSGELPKNARAIFWSANVSSDRLHLDYRATDTVTNFTSLIQDLRRYHIQHLYLVTSDFHMLRAVAIATIVLGSQGIYFTPISVPSDQPEEPFLQIVRDVGRSIVWIFTGHTGASLKGRW